ncbi:subtilisin family serine protease [Cupriavidus alkaliphilus]|uniref:S8 family peptidase n=1 Tax=Cupriavidus alkaliphilus TaxID=942866 RepID=UPI000DE6EE6B|nr:S8 family peptidase [Cupriavidus alkaliphilus]PVY69176.1 subtilisin family serine protease [Cupriavidus alkaliphilus]
MSLNRMTPSEQRAAYMLIFAGCEAEPDRFTSDLPVSSEVWLLYASGESFEVPRGLLLTPHHGAGIAALRAAVLRRLPALADPAADEAGARFLAANESHLLAQIDFFDMLRLLPLTAWWQREVRVPMAAIRWTPAARSALALSLTGDALVRWLGESVLAHVGSEAALARFKDIGYTAARTRFGGLAAPAGQALGRLVNVAAQYVALTLLGLRDDSFPPGGLTRRVTQASRQVLETLWDCLRQDHAEAATPAAGIAAGMAAGDVADAAAIAPLWRISVNRPAEHAVFASRKTVKADAAIRVFDTGGQGVRWAVIDSGIDARHPAFFDPLKLDGPLPVRDGLIAPRLSRVVRTLDFTRLSAITSGRLPPMPKGKRGPGEAELRQRVAAIAEDLAHGRIIDWSVIEPLLEISHDDPAQYVAPGGSHGTHVAGIIGAGWPSSAYLVRPDPMPLPPELVEAGEVSGICPRIELLDLRIFDAQGRGDEFGILGALQYVRWLNQSRDRQSVHGINLSVALRHDVRSYACGSTPVCVECDRLVASGVIVVAAAGNYGYDEAFAAEHMGAGFRGQTITDPGNARAVITVGATHRTDPYRFGISYFSSHGPTGDGRIKPDLVAPGEKITSTVPGGTLASMDGTSMAAPHVSGVAALLLSRNNELMGQPETVKTILCAAATDLGRERAFQGAGLVDALRALQRV